MITILDTNRNVMPKLATLKALGITDIGRYIAPGLEREEKVIKPDEARAIADAGMRLFLILEIGTHTASGATAGHAHGVYALDYAKNTLHMPEGTGIYPCADYDAQPNDYPAIRAHCVEFRAAIAPLYRNGLYANGYICSRAKADGVIDFRFLTCSKGFLGTRDAIAAGAYEILQALPTPIAGLDSDPDTLHVANGDFGSRVPFAAPSIAPAAPVVAQHPSIQPVSLLARIEHEFGLS